MKAQHWLVGYDPRTELGVMELAIPENAFREIGSVVSFDRDDPEAIGCYELSDKQAREIASWLGDRPLPTGLSFYLEATEATDVR